MRWPSASATMSSVRRGGVARTSSVCTCDGAHGHGFEDWVVEVLRQGVLDEQLLELQRRTRDGQVLLAIGDLGLGLEDIHRGDGLELQLLAAVGEGLVGEVERTRLHLLVLVGGHEVPVHVGDLRDGGDDLQLEGLVGDLLVVACDAQIAQVGTESEAGEQLLLQRRPEE